MASRKVLRYYASESSPCIAVYLSDVYPSVYHAQFTGCAIFFASYRNTLLCIYIYYVCIFQKWYLADGYIPAWTRSSRSKRALSVFLLFSAEINIPANILLLDLFL